MLLYGNDIEIQRIYYGTTGGGAYDEWAVDRIEAYRKIRDNLLVHDSSYPTADYYLERLMRADAKGAAQSVIDLLKQDDDRPLWYLIWGPGEEMLIGDVMALMGDLPEGERHKLLAKLRLFSIWSQSLTPSTGGDGRAPWFPGKVFTINSRDQFKAIAYRNDWNNAIDPPDSHFISDRFQSNFEGHGPLSDYYIGPAKGKNRTLEGDSPSFLHVLPVGLRSLENPSYGGWGGRFQGPRFDGLHYVDVPDSEGNSESQLYKPMSRWFGAMQNDYAARCDWAVAGSYGEANHQPVAKVAHPLDITVKPGERVNLSAAGSSDPDGDEIAYKWWRYADADSYEGDVVIEGTSLCAPSFVFPGDGSGETVHVILEVQDQGEPKLTRYQRVIVTGAE